MTAKRGESRRKEKNMAPIIAAIDTVTEVVTGLFTVMTANAYLTVFLAVGLLGAGIGVFRRLRGAAR